MITLRYLIIIYVVSRNKVFICSNSSLCWGLEYSKSTNKVNWSWTWWLISTGYTHDYYITLKLRVVPPVVLLSLIQTCISSYLQMCNKTKFIFYVYFLKTHITIPANVFRLNEIMFDCLD